MKAQGVEPFLIGIGEFLVKGFSELPVVFLGDGVLGGEPQVLLRIQRVLKAGVDKGTDGNLRVVLALKHGGAFGLGDGERLLLAAPALETQSGDTRFVRHQLHGLIHVAIGVAGHSDGFFPPRYRRTEKGQQNGGAERRPVQNGADGSVGGGPDLRQVIFLLPMAVGGDGGAFDCHAQPLCGIGRVNGHLIPRLVAMTKTQIVVLRFQVHVGLNQFVLNDLPEDAGHFVPIHLHQRHVHFDFFHISRSSFDNSSSGSRPTEFPALPPSDSASGGSVAPFPRRFAAAWREAPPARRQGPPGRRG
ncbi:hypothetical protein SDC9_126745 [bioreactor metagenome]|uniref:Uncharacterized protein n=1 Tax=bioreactor metagenome TaxID=1076179 RepID=A0A645CRJ6_9ZZZZ